MATFLLLIGAILTAQWVSWALYRSARRHAVIPNAGTVVMVYCPSIRLAAVLLPAASIGLLLLLSSRPELLGETVTGWLNRLLPLLAAAAGVIAVEAWSRRIVLAPAGLESRSLLGSTRIAWDEIETVRWDRWRKLIVLVGRDGRRVNVNPSLSGLAAFQLFLLERVPRERFDPSLPGVIALHRGHY